MCIPYKWYDDEPYFRLSYVTADKLIAGQYGFLNRLLYYCLILFAILAASKSWLCWVRVFQNDHHRVSVTGSMSVPLSTRSPSSLVLTHFQMRDADFTIR